MNLKCSICKITQDEENFSWRNAAKKLKSDKCKKCQSALSKAHYQRNKDAYRESVRRTRVKYKKILFDLKNSPCSICGKTYPPECMDFDHLRDKEFGIGEMFAKMMPLTKINIEIEKCQLLCVLCHRDKTFNAQKRGAGYEEREKINSLFKNKGCSICGQIFLPHQMDFDHLPKFTKTDNVSNMIQTGTSLERVISEIAKCRLLCCVCHRLETFKTQTKQG